MKRLDTTDPRAVAAAIADRIEESPHLHDQRWWFGGSDCTAFQHNDYTVQDLRILTEKCGTAACVAGWAALLTLPDDATWIGIKDSFTSNGSTVLIENLARSALGLNDADANYLFGATRTHRQVLAALRSLAEGKPMTWLDPNDEDGE